MVEAVLESKHGWIPLYYLKVLGFKGAGFVGKQLSVVKIFNFCEFKPVFQNEIAWYLATYIMVIDSEDIVHDNLHKCPEFIDVRTVEMLQSAFWELHLIKN